MKRHIYNNTDSREHTHMLAAIELIQEGRKEFNMCSENWAYPTPYKFGMPTDYYYAEVWIDGMDWDCVYWLIEAASLDNPRIYPMVYFEDSNDRDRYNDCDFRDLCRGIMHYRRDMTWIKSKDPKGYYSDSVWPFVSRVEPEDRMEKCPCMVRYKINHASQKPVEFYLNEDLIPSESPRGNRIEDGNVLITTEYPKREVEDAPNAAN